jgi:hypothetical protein
MINKYPVVFNNENFEATINEYKDRLTGKEFYTVSILKRKNRIFKRLVYRKTFHRNICYLITLCAA